MPKDGWTSVSIDEEIHKFLLEQKENHRKKIGWRTLSFNDWFYTMKKRGKFNE